MTTIDPGSRNEHPELGWAMLEKQQPDQAPLDGSHERVELPPHGGEPVTQAPDYTRNAPLTDVAQPLLENAKNLSPQDIHTIPERIAPGAPQKTAEASEPRFSRRTKLMAGASALVAAAGIYAAVSGGSDTHAPRSVTTHSAPETVKPTVTAPEINPEISSDPTALNSFFTKELTFYGTYVNGGPTITDEQMKQHADAIWPYFSENAKSSVESHAANGESGLAAWEAQFAKVSPYFQTGYQPVLKNGSDVLSAANTHNDVQAVSFTTGTDGNYNITINEKYDSTTNSWLIDSFLTLATSEDQ